MKTIWPAVHRGIVSGLIAFVLSIPSLADQTITGNLTVTGAATVNGTAAVGGDVDVEGNNLTLGNNAGNYGVGTFYLPSGSDGARWRLTRVSAWLWEVDNAGTVTPAMRLDASNNLTLYGGGAAALTLNPAAKSLSLGSATLTADGTSLTTNGSFSVTGTFSAPSLSSTSGTVTGGASGLALNAGGTDQNITLTPSGAGNVIVYGNLGVGTSAPTAKLDVAGDVNVGGNLKLVAGSASRAPLTLQSGRLLITPVFGAVEFNGTNLYVTTNAASPTRQPLAYAATTLAGYGITDPVALTSESYADPAWITALSTAKLTGTLPTSSLPAFTGDVTSSAGSANLILANSGVPAGTYAKVTVDAKGRVTAGASLSSGDVTTALGFTPVNKAGDTLTGALGATTLTATSGTVTGGTAGLTLSAGGSNQNIALAPSGTGNTLLGGNVGIGTSAPAAKLEVAATGTGMVPNIASFGHATGGQMKISADSSGSLFLHNRWATYNPATSRWEWTATTTTGAGLLTLGTGANYELAFDVRNSASTTSGQPVNFVRALTLREEGVTVPGSLTVGGNFSAPNYTASSGTITGGNTGLTLTAGGTNQNVTLVPSGTGKVTTNLGDVAALSSNGFAARTGSGAYAARAIVGTAGQVNVANGDGVAGNPTISLPSTITQATTFSGGLGLTTTVNDGEMMAVGSGIGGPYISTSATSATAGSRFHGFLLRNNGAAQWGMIQRGDANFHVYDYVGTASRFIIRSTGDVTLTPQGNFNLSAGRFVVSNTTASTSTTTGSATFGGGIGVAGAVWATGGSDTGFHLFRSASSSVVASLIQDGTNDAAQLRLMTGGVAKVILRSNTGGTNILANPLSVTDATDATSTTTGALQVAGGGSFQKNLHVGGSTVLTGNLKLGAGTTTVAPLTLQTGTPLTTPTFGAVEFDGTNLYVTNNSSSPTRKPLAYAATTLSDYGITDPVALTNGNYANPAWITSFAASKLTGTLPSALLPAFGGDATSSAGSATLTLANSGVVAGTYAKVTVDAKGRVTAGAVLAPSDVTTALGYAPVNKAGDTMTGGLTATALTASNGTVTGGSAGLALSAGGSNQNIALAPSGTGSVVTAAPVAIANATPTTSPTTGALTVVGGVGVTGSVNVGGGIATGGLTNYPVRIHTLNLSAQPATQFFPITLTGLPQGKIYHFSIELPSQAASSAFNQHSLAGTARGGGWSDCPSFFEVTNTYYDGNERSVLGLYRGTQGWQDVALYVRGGATYYLTTDAPSVAVYTTAQTFGDTTFAIKDSTGADVSGASAAITRMFDSYSTATGRYTDRALATSATIASTSPATGALTVAGGVGIAGDLNVGGTFSATNYTTSGGTVSGGAAGLTLNAGGTNQNVALVPSGTGKVTTNLGDVAALSANGFAARTGSGAYAARAIVGTAGQVNVANGDGVAGNPTISLPSTITQATTFSGKLTVSDTTTATSASTGSATFAGGLGVAGESWYGDGGTGAGITINKAANANHLRFSVGGSVKSVLFVDNGDKLGVFGSDFRIVNTTASTGTTTGALTVAGGIGVAGTVSARNVSASSSAGVLPAGTTSGQNMIYVSGSGDVGGTSDLRPTSIQATALGANSMAVRALDVGANAQNTAGSVSMLGVRVLTNLTNTGNGSGTAFSASPYVTSAGNLAWWVGYEADNGGFTSTGDVAGPMTAFRNATFGRPAATTVTAFHAQDLVKGSGIAAGFRGQVSAATGKYNLYLDGTAANLLAGQTSITNATASTSSTTGALTVAGGVGINGDLNVSGTFSATNYTASAGLNLTAGGNNQNVTVTPSGTGSTVLNGKVGIGTTAPTAKLDVTGGNIVVSAPSANNQDLFIANAGGRKVEIVTDAEGDGKLMLRDAGGTTTQVAITAGGTSYFNGGNVGIGTSSPSGKFTIADSGQVLSFLTNQKLTGSWPATAEANTMTIQSSGSSSGAIAFANGNSESMRITAGGAVGIGTSAPGTNGAKLDVNGQITVSAIPSGTGVRVNSSNNAAHVAYSFYNVSTDTYPVFQVRRGTLASGGPLLEWGDSGNAPDTNLYKAGTATLRTNATLLVDGNVGIGTAAPTAKLDVAGNANIAGTLKLGAGTPTVAPLTLQNGSVLTTATFGAVEFDGTNLYVTNNSASPTRKPIAYAATTLSGYGITDPIALTSGSYANPSWITSLAASKLTGTVPAASLPAFSGDATSSAGSSTLTLANSGVAAGTYSKVTVDAKGRVTAGAVLESIDVTTALNYTPVNRAGDTLTGSLTATTLAASDGTLTGGASGLTLNAGGADKNITLAPSGTGNTVLGGKVGIGTASPSAALTIASAANTRPSVTTSAAEGSAQWVFENSADADSAWAVGRDKSGAFWIERSTGATFGTGTITQPLVIDTAGNVGIATTSPTAKLDVAGDVKVTGNLVVTGTLTAANSTGGGTNGVITGSTNGLSLNAGGAGNQNITLNPTGAGSVVLNGNVGIGTSAPAQKFEVSGGYARISYASAPFLDFYHSAAAADLKTTRIGSRDGALLFESVNDAYTTPIERMRIAANGNVGIGTTSPESRLHVMGSVSLDGTFGGIFTGADQAPYNATGVLLRSTAPKPHIVARLPVADSTGAFSVYNSADQAIFRVFGDGNTVIGNNYPASAKFTLSGSATINGGLTNATPVRPVVGSGTLNTGEIRGISGQGAASDDGFLRVSAGGGASATSKSFIDLTGYSTVPTMNNTIVLGTSGTDRLRITDTGNVGIGTPTPTAKLHVNGTARFDGPVRIAKQGDLEMGEFHEEPPQ